MAIRHLLGAAALCLASLAHAADYPAKPVTIVVPFPAGGSSDMIGRVLASSEPEGNRSRIRSLVRSCTHPLISWREPSALPLKSIGCIGAA